MKKFLYLIFLLPEICFGLPKTMIIINAYTGEPDYINNLSSTPISALLGGTTLEQMVENLAASTGTTNAIVNQLRIDTGTLSGQIGALNSSTSTFQSQINVVNSTLTQVRTDTGTLSAQVRAIGIATSTILLGGSTSYAAQPATALSTAALNTAVSTTGIALQNFQFAVAATTGANYSALQSSAALDSRQFSFAFSSISTLQTATGTLASQVSALTVSTISLLLNGGNTNYALLSSSGNFIDTSGSVQTKIGSLYLGTALGFTGVAAMSIDANGNIKVGRSIGGFSGSRNEVLGDNSATSGASGSDNLAVGPLNMQGIALGGQFNSYVGSSLTGPTTGSFNAVFSNQGINLRVGDSNTGVGGKLNNFYSVNSPNGNSANNMTLGTLVGYLAGGSDVGYNLYNVTAIGANAVVSASNMTVIGDTNSTVVIGTTAALSGNTKLDVYNGSVTVRGPGAKIYTTGEVVGSSMTVSSSSFFSTGGGFVAIGVTRPVDILHVNGRVRIASATAGGGGCFRLNGTTQLLEWSNDCVTFSTFPTATNASANGWTRSGTTELQTTNTDNVIVGAGGVSRATKGITISQSTAPAFLPNVDIGDSARILSLVDENGNNSVIPLSFRSNTGGGVLNQMLDIKFVNNNDGTSKLVWSWGPNAAFTDRFVLTSSGTQGVNVSSPQVVLDVGGQLVLRSTQAVVPVLATNYFTAGYDANGARSYITSVSSTGGSSRQPLIFDASSYSFLSGGNVAISTTNANGYRLFVNGDDRINTLGVYSNSPVRQPGIYYEAEPTGYKWNEFIHGTLGGFAMYEETGGAAGTGYRIFIASGGKVGINTTGPSSQLDVFNGSITTRGSNSGLTISGVGTTGSSANAFFDASGNLLKSTSSRRYKRNIQPMFQANEYNKVLSAKAITFLDVEPAKVHLDPKTQFIFDDRATEIIFGDNLTVTVPTQAQGIEYSQDPVNPWVLDYKWASREPGFIAEDFDQAGLKELVVYDKQGQPDAIKYDRLTTYLLEVIKNQELRIEALEAKP